LAEKSALSARTELLSAVLSDLIIILPE